MSNMTVHQFQFVTKHLNHEQHYKDAMLSVLCCGQDVAVAAKQYKIDESWLLYATQAIQEYHEGLLSVYCPEETRPVDRD